MKNVRINTPSDWKRAVKSRLVVEGISRYRFVRDCVDSGICDQHTAECLLADENTVTGKRYPTFARAIDMAKLAGYDVVLVPRTGRAKL
jgi:hypothetical protein